MTKKKVIILYGGRSVEHGVSINSARNIIEYIDKDEFEPLSIGISKEGKWFLTETVSKDIEKGKPLSLILDPSHPGFTVLADNSEIYPDIIFPVLHGTDGEDGSIQGLIKTVSIPMVGTGVLGSAVSMNKITTKRLLNDAGIPSSRFLTFHYAERESISFQAIVKELGLPFMVKASSLGSSVGVSKVKSEADFIRSIEESFSYGHDILVEEFINAREIECAVLGNNPAQASDPGEIIISGDYDFYTFDAKYVDGDAVKINLPAKITEKEAEAIRRLAIKTFQTLNCHDFARVDIFLTPSGDIYINEINTIPGFTNSSMFPMMWKERGISFTELITQLIHLAWKRHEQDQRINHDFNSLLKF